MSKNETPIDEKGKGIQSAIYTCAICGKPADSHYMGNPICIECVFKMEEKKSKVEPTPMSEPSQEIKKPTIVPAIQFSEETPKMEEPVIEKKRRGRPPKIIAEGVEPSTPKRRGRPPKAKVESTEPVIPKKRGRPPKVAK